MKYKKICEICDTDFETNRDWQKFCSKKCRYTTLKSPESTSPWIRLRFEVLARDDFKCQYCGRNVSDGIKLEVDHIFPKSKGGKDTLSNLKTACNECNLGKSDRLLSEMRLNSV